MSDARQFLNIDAPFRMMRGVLPQVEIAYETWGELSA